MKQRGVFLIGLILMGVYYFLFPRGTGRELVLIPESYVPLDSGASVPVDSSRPVLAIRNAAAAGYLDESFRLSELHHGSLMAVDDEWLAVARRNGVDLLDPDGRIRARIAGEAVPMARNGQLYLYRESIGRLTMVDPANGRTVWTRDFLSPLTVLDGVAGRTLVGLMDGRVMVVDDEGGVMLRYSPGGSRVEVVYGGSLSSDGTRIALVAGLDPQRFILLEERKNGFRPVHHHDAGTDFRRWVPVGFVNGDERVLYEGSGSVVAVDVDGFDIGNLDLEGRPLDWSDDTGSGSLALLGSDGKRAVLRLLSRDNRVLFESGLPEGESGVMIADGRLMLIGEDHLGLMEMTIR